MTHQQDFLSAFCHREQWTDYQTHFNFCHFYLHRPKAPSSGPDNYQQFNVK